MALNASGEGNTTSRNKGGDLTTQKFMGRETNNSSGGGNLNTDEGSMNGNNKTTRYNNGDANANNQSQDVTNQQINKIKADLIATIIMEKTRNLSNELKSNLKSFCDREQFEEIYEKSGEFGSKREDIIKNLRAFHYTNLNPLNIISVRKLDFQEKTISLLNMYN